MSKRKKCDKCNGEGGVLWLTADGNDAIWRYCEDCGGTGEVKNVNKV